MINPSCHGNQAPSFNISCFCFLVWGLYFGKVFFSYLFNLQICEKMSAMGIKRTHCLELSRNHGDLKVSLTEKYHTQDLESKQQNIRTGLESVSQASCVASFFIQAILLIPQRSHSIKKNEHLAFGGVWQHFEEQ